jgi:hypothetical protein
VRRALVVLVVGLAACRPWDEAAEARLAELDAGTVDAGPIDAGVEDAGSVDAGADAGADAGVDAGADAGSDGGLVLVRFFHFGASLRGFNALADGGFIGVARNYQAGSLTAAQVVEVSPSSSTARLGTLPSSIGFGTVEVHEVVGARTDYFVTTQVGAYHVVNDVEDVDFSWDCGGLSSYNFWGVTREPSGDVTLSGSRSQVCRWDHVTKASTVSTLVAGSTATIRAQLLFPDDAFFATDEELVYQPRDGGAVMVSPRTDTSWALAGLRADDVWAVGDGPGARWDGMSWQALLAAPVGLTDVWLSSEADVWAVGGPSVVKRNPDSLEWEVVPLPPFPFDAGTDPVIFKSVAGHGPHDLLVSGTHCAPDCFSGTEYGFALIFSR